MSFSLLVTLTVLEIIVFVAALGTFLYLISRHLRSIAATLGKVTFGVRAVEQQCSVIGPGVTQVNRTLEEIAGALPGVAEKAEALAGRR